MNERLLGIAGNVHKNFKKVVKEVSGRTEQNMSTKHDKNVLILSAQCVKWND